MKELSDYGEYSGEIRANLQTKLERILSINSSGTDMVCQY